MNTTIRERFLMFHVFMPQPFRRIGTEIRGLLIRPYGSLSRTMQNKISLKISIFHLFSVTDILANVVNWSQDTHDEEERICEYDRRKAFFDV